MGHREAANLNGAGSTDVRAYLYGEKGETDQVYLSIFVDESGNVRARQLDPEQARTKPELDENEIKRIWLFLLIDVASRMPLAWIVSETADSDHMMALLRMATRDKTKEKMRYQCKNNPAPAVGLMLASADNGTATRNPRIYAAELGVDTTVITGRTYHAADKPYVERSFGTMQWQLLNFLPGYTGSRPRELPGYNPKGKAILTTNDIFGEITRYFIDRYPVTPHRGTGMFGATPLQKMYELIETYGDIDAPIQDDRIKHLGMRAQATIDTEGVRFKGIPFNSTELQTFGDHPENRKVTIHLDPDDLRKVLITSEGTPEVVTANLSMTQFQDLSLEEALDVMLQAVEANPELRKLHAENLNDAIRRQANASGHFKSSLLPEGYGGEAALEKKAEALLRVECIPPRPMAATTPPRMITDRSGKIPAFAVGSAPSTAKGAAPAKQAKSQKIFQPVKESKL